jgi:hypothetical protein
MGHHVLRDVLMGRVHAIGYDAVRGEYVGCPDPRAYGGAAAP